MHTTLSKRSLRRELHDAPGFSAWALLLAVLGSVTGAIITNAFGSGKWGALAGAALGPVISTTFSTKRTGEKGRVRNATIIILSTGALLITVTGFSFADRVAGKSIIAQRTSTFPWEPIPSGSSPTPSTPSTPSASGTGGALDIKVQPTGPLDCGTVAVGTPASCPQPVTITSTGTDVLRITSVEVTGPDSSDFTPSQDCAGKSLSPNQTCDLQVGFTPTAAGPRQATLVIHQNIPWPDQGTRITLIGTGNGKPSPTITLPPATLKDAIRTSVECSAGPYSEPIPVEGGTPPYGFSVTAGILPPGLELNPKDGIISGTPTTTGSYTFTITVTDSSPNEAFQTYTIRVLNCIG